MQERSELTPCTRREFLRYIGILITGIVLTEVAKFFAFSPWRSKFIRTSYLYSRYDSSTTLFSPEEIGILYPYQEIPVNVRSEGENYKIRCYVFKPTKSTDLSNETVFILHGYNIGITDENGYYIGGMWSDYEEKVEIINRLCNLGYNVVLFSHRGHLPTSWVNPETELPSHPLSYGYLESEDTFHVLRHFKDVFGLMPDNTYIWGISGGSISAIYAVNELQGRYRGKVVDKIFIDSAVADMRQSFGQAYLRLAELLGFASEIERQISKIGYDPNFIHPISIVHRIMAKIYIVHGRHDIILSSHQARRYQDYGIEVCFREGAVFRHQVFRSVDPTVYTVAMDGFFRGNVVPDLSNVDVYEY